MRTEQVRQLVEKYTLKELMVAEKQIKEGKFISIEIQGETRGDMLTHVLAASYVKEKMSNEQKDFNTILRVYASRVRVTLC